MSFKNQTEQLAGNKTVEFIYPVHEIDSFNGEELKNHISALENVSAVVINFSDITYLNSSGLRELLQILKILKENDILFFLTEVSADINKIFVHTNLNKLFTIVDTDQDVRNIVIG